MKKKLEADLISIAHRILKLKNKSELDQLYLETQQLYEKLAVLKFVENHFADAKPTIGHQEVTETLQTVFEQEEETVPENNVDDASAEITQETTTEPEVIAEPDSSDSEQVKQSTDEETEATDEEHEIEAVEEETPAATEEEETPSATEAQEEETTEEPEAENTEEAETEDETEEESSKEGDITPSFDLTFEKKEEEPKETPKQISFEDFLGNYTEPVFEKVSDKKEETPAAIEEEETPSATEEQEAAAFEQETPEIIEQEEEPEEEETPDPDPSDSEQAKQTDEEENDEAEPEEEETEEAEEEAPASVEKTPEPTYEPVQPATEKPLRSFTFGLNDRIGFEKHLFGGSSEDMNRVVSQLSTFDSFDEARDFIEEMVKPDYNNWEGKDDYAQRFLDIVERKFN